MNNYFNGHEYNTGFSNKCAGDENFPKQIDKYIETDRLRKTSIRWINRQNLWKWFSNNQMKLKS